MQRSICFIENLKDRNLILANNDLKEVLFAPLNLETFIFCKKNKFKIFDFKKYISNDFHKKTLKVADKFVQSLKFKEKINYSLKAEIIFFLRFRLNSILFLTEIIKKAKKNYNINNIIVSGLRKDFHKNLHDGNLVTEIIQNLFDQEINIQCLVKNNKKDFVPPLYGYFTDINIDTKNKNIFLGNAGYNFNRLIKIFRENKKSVWVPFFDNLSLLKKFIYFFRKFRPMYFKRDKVKKPLKVYIEKINFINDGTDLSFLLNNFYKKLNFYFNDVVQKSLALKKIINEKKFVLTISNIAKGFNGSILDKDVKCNSLCISHGIIVSANNEFDKIYKKIIAEAVFKGESKYFAIQSKTMMESLKTHEISGKKIQTGNIVFSSLQKKSNKKYILHASTIKNFTNLQFLGVEMFYEYWNLLECLDIISKNEKIKFLVKPHPTIKHCITDLKKFLKI